jgi:glycosyltransferase involved in cell wall biosynthesis
MAMKLKHKIALISSHPIQYNSPIFRLLAEQNEIELKVFFTWGEKSIDSKFDPDFGRVIEWDIPLLEGFDYHLSRNVAKKPGSHHFRGIITPDLINEIKEFKPDVIWIWGWAFQSHLKVMMSFKGKTPIWFRGDSTLIDESKGFSLKKNARRIFLNWVYSYVDKVFSVGTNNSEYFEKHGIKQENIILAPHSIDNLRFLEESRKSKFEVEKKRKELGIGSNKFVLLFAGKLEEKKNPLFFLEVCKRMINTDVTGIIIGNGKLESSLKKNAENIIFLDFQNQSNMPSFYCLANIFVLPSNGPGETWGLSMNESLACGVPVAASIHCGGSVDLIDENNGFIFDPKDGVDSFIEKLTNFRNQPSTDFRSEFLYKFNYQRIVDAVIKELN